MPVGKWSRRSRVSRIVEILVLWLRLWGNRAQCAITLGGVRGSLTMLIVLGELRGGQWPISRRTPAVASHHEHVDRRVVEHAIFDAS